MRAFISSQFGYCPLVWMFHSRRLNNRINNIHERALRLVYRDYSRTSFKALLQIDKSVTITPTKLTSTNHGNFQDKGWNKPRNNE